MQRWRVIVVGAVVLAACGGDDGDGGAVFDTSGREDVDASEVSDTATASDDAVASTDDTTSADDTAVAVDTVETGDKAVGDPCAADAECQSGICLASSLGSACTAACEAEADCDGFPIGMYCLPVRVGGRSGCVPEGAAPPTTCGDHADCAWPLYCRPDDVGCDLPECLLDGDCPDGQVCEAAARRCQPASCTDDLDCKHPALYCADDQTCAPPLCDQDADCGARPAYCHPVQRECKTAATCEDEDGCFYNETCDGGFCLPDLCYAGCQAGETCDPASGWCGAACSGSGRSTCPAGEACLPSGVCKPNEAPVAVIEVSGAPDVVGVASVGEAIILDGAGSLDPEGEALTFAWTLLEVPAGSGQAVGAAVGGGAATISVTPDAAGRFVVGLIVRDPAGLAGIQAAATVVASE